MILIFISCQTKQKKKLSEEKNTFTYDLNEVYQQGNFNGFSVPIVDENVTLYEKGIGFQMLKNTKNIRNIPFRILDLFLRPLSG